MLAKLFLVSAVAAVVCLALSQVSHPAVFGVRSEPARILYYGLSGFLAGLFTLTAVLTGIVWTFKRARSRRSGHLGGPDGA